MVAKARACFNDCQWELLIKNMKHVVTFIGMAAGKNNLQKNSCPTLHKIKIGRNFLTLFCLFFEKSFGLKRQRFF